MPCVARGNVAVIYGITVTLLIVSFNCLTGVIFQKNYSDAGLLSHFSIKNCHKL